MSDDGSLRIWATEGGDWFQLAQLDFNFTLMSVSWSQHDMGIAVCGRGNGITVAKLDPEQRKLSIDYTIEEAHNGLDVNCIAWCPLKVGASLLASCGDDNLVRIWDTSSHSTKMRE